MDRRLESLAGLLAGFHPAHPQQVSAKRRVLELLDTGGDPTSRSHFEPGHITASAFVASPTRDAVLLIHHDKLGTWLQPGGHVEAIDADMEAAARREVEEETGLRDCVNFGLLDLDIHPYPARGEEPAHLHFDVRLAFLAETGVIRAGDGTRAARWIPYADIARWNPEPSVTRPVAALAGLIAADW